MKLDSLPEVETREDNDLIILSKDGVHLNKMTAKNFGRGLGGGSGSLEYWKENKNAFYKDTTNDPTYMKSIITRHTGVKVDGVDYEYYEVFDRKFGYVASDATRKQQCLNFAKTLAIGALNSSGAQPEDYVFGPLTEITGEERYTTTVNQSLSRYRPIDYNWSTPNAGIYFPLDIDQNRTPGLYGYCGRIMLEVVDDFEEDPSSIVLNSDATWYEGVLGTLPTNPRPQYGAGDRCYTNHMYQFMPVDNGAETGRRIARSGGNGTYTYKKTMPFFFTLTCQGKVVDDDPDSDRYQTTLSSEFYWVTNPGVSETFFDKNNKTWEVDTSSNGHEVTRRTRDAMITFIDEDSVKWRLDILSYCPAYFVITQNDNGDYFASLEEAEAYLDKINDGTALRHRKKPDATYVVASRQTSTSGDMSYYILETIDEAPFPEIGREVINDLDLGFIHQHWSIYEGAEPEYVDTPWSYTSGPIKTLSDESIAKYSENLYQLALDIKEALGVQGISAVMGPDEEGGIPGDVSYKVHTSLENSEEGSGTVFSAGYINSDGTYTETIKMDAIKGTMLLNGEPIGSGGGGGVLTPVFSTGTKIADYTTDSGNTELYIPGDSGAVPNFKIVTNLYTYFYRIRKIDIWNGDFNKYYATSTINTMAHRDIYEVYYTARSTAGTYPSSVTYSIPLHSDNKARYASSGNALGAEYDFIPLTAEVHVRRTSTKIWEEVTPSIAMSSDYSTATLSIPNQSSSVAFDTIIIKLTYVG